MGLEKDTWVDHDGLQFHCRIDGPEGAPWVVFCNSLLTDVTMWDAQVAALPNRRVLRYDQRGHGKTTVPDGPATLAQLGDDLIAILDAIAVESCDFVGISMGVPTGLHLYDRAPGRVRRLLLSDGQSATAPTGAANWQARIDAAQAGGMEAAAAEAVARWFGAESLDEDGARQVMSVARQTPLGGFVACARALQDYDYRHVLPKLSVPVLLVAGANDGAMPQSMQVMATSIPGARLAVIPDAGHLPPVEQPQRFNIEMTEFFA